MTERIGLLVTLEAKPGKEDDVVTFLNQGQALVAQEPATIKWYALRLGPTTFAIFDTFADEDGRQAHLSGPVAEALGTVSSDLLASQPEIRPIDVLASTPTR